MAGFAGYPPTDGQPVIAMQPMMQMPQSMHPNPNIPSGLEYLTAVDKLFIKQKVELLEAFVGFETKNKYAVKAPTGQDVYFAVEDTGCCNRNCCGSSRAFDMQIVDMSQRQVLHLYRPLRCDSCCCPCCLQEIVVSTPDGTVLGYVKQNWSICKPSFRIENEAQETVLMIQGPFCTCNMCGGSVDFQVLSRDGEVEVGKISKEWSGVTQELFTDADLFGISFPMDLDVRMKAVVMGACFLIDFMFFESED